MTILFKEEGSPPPPRMKHTCRYVFFTPTPKLTAVNGFYDLLQTNSSP